MSSQAPSVLSLPQVDFSERLLSLRKQRGMTQQALADASGIHVVQVRRYETAKAQPDFDSLRKLARGLGASGDELLFDEGERRPLSRRERLQLKLEAADRLDDEEFRVIEQVIEGVLLKHEVKRLTASA